ncbi:MAG: cellulase family glycosylhydrolase [Candidatus Dormibacteraceae bacterium]
MARIVTGKLLRAAALFLLVVFAIATYPGADLVSLAIRLTPAASPSSPAPAALLPWLHVAHPAEGTPYIADDQGRMVLLHGITPASLVDYWSGSNPLRSDPAPFYPIDPAAYDGRCPSNYSVIGVPPLCHEDIDQMASFGFNLIRLPLSWSLLEPRRGRFSKLYLDRIAQVVGWAGAAGIHVILDMHQNAYSRYVGTSSPPPLPGGAPAQLQYYSGAPAWATFTDGLPSEAYGNQRELNPAVMEADTNFWYNRDGIQDEYIATIAYLARRFKDDSTVVGYSLFNEPWPGWTLPPGFEDLLLFPFYRRAIDAIAGIHDGLPCPTHVFMPAVCGYPDLGIHDLRHLFFLEPGLLREVTDFSTHLGLPVSSDPNLVLSIHAYTHIYTIDHLLGLNAATYPWGGFDQSYALAEREAKAINAAVFVSEFGNPPSMDTLLANQLLEQERHLVGSAFWDWKENCGGWAMFEGDPCISGDTSPRRSSGCLRTSRERLLARIYPRASPDFHLSYHYDPATGAFRLEAQGQTGDAQTVVYIPHEVTGAVGVIGGASAPVIDINTDGGRVVSVSPAGGAFVITVAAAPLALTACV